MSTEQTREQRLEALLNECLRYLFYKPLVARIKAALDEVKRPPAG